MIAAIILSLGLWCAPDHFRVPFDNPVPPAPNPVWSDSTKTVNLSGGRGEKLAFQIVFPPVHRDCIFFAFSDLYYSGTTYPGAWETFWNRPILVNPKRPSIPGRLGPGWYREQLYPLGDCFSVGETEEVVWVDMEVPHAPPGIYYASIAVRADGIEEAITVRLKIHNFTIPETAKPFIAGFQLGKLEQVTHRPWHETIGPFIAMARDHGIDLMIRGWPDTPMKWPDHDRVLGPYIRDAKMWLLPVTAYYQLPYLANEDSALVAFRYQETERHWREQGYPLSRALTWQYDEPKTKSWCLYPSEIQAYSRTIRDGTDSIRIMVTERADSALAGANDIIMTRAFYCVPGPTRWPYQDPDGKGMPLPAIDMPASAFRLWPWFMMRYPIGGVFYWAVNSWDPYHPYDMPDGQPQTYGDGNGTMMWPDIFGGPVMGVRGKMVRRGMQDVAIMEMAQQQGQWSVVFGILSSTIRKGLYEGTDWETDGAVLDQRIEILRGNLR